MNALIVSTNRYFNPAPVMPLGACMVAEASERAGHCVSMLDLMFECDPLRSLRYKLDECHPDIVGLSVRNIDNTDMEAPQGFHADLLNIVKCIRSRTQVPIVIGGPAVGIMPEILLRLTGASWAVIGDGDAAFPQLLTLLEGDKPPHEIAGLAWMDNGVFIKRPRQAGPTNYECSVPDFSRWVNVRKYTSHLSTAPVQTKRGCRFDCVYCTCHGLEGHAYRLCSPQSVVDSVCRLASMGLRDVEFVDNVFNSPYDHALAICEGIANARPRVRLQTLELHPLFTDDALLSAMESACFSGIGVTVESASDSVLERLRKGFAMEDVRKAAGAVRRHKLPCAWIFMFGCPGETRSTVMETLEFIHGVLRPCDIAFFTAGVRIYPGTELELQARAEGLLPGSPDDLLEPVFYLSPELDGKWLTESLGNFTASHLNCLSSNSVALPLLPQLHRLAHKLGIGPPLWKYTRHIRRLLKVFMPKL
jgi:radical SAM superfamily enzyme YgiQ (UPF0313 family)